LSVFDLPEGRAGKLLMTSYGKVRLQAKIESLPDYELLKYYRKDVDILMNKGVPLLFAQTDKFGLFRQPLIFLKTNDNLLLNN
jgi:hypothetical protein